MSPSENLDRPSIGRRPLLRRPDSETFGKLSEAFARYMGTPTFLLQMSAFIIAWVVWNFVGPEALRFDPYTFTFLTLLLSLQASYAAPLILLAQNRQDDRDRVLNEQDRSRDERGLADTEYLTREVAALRIALREVATRDFVRSELRSILEELADEGVTVSASPSRDAKRKGGKKRKRVSEPAASTPAAEPDSGSEREVPTPDG